MIILAVYRLIINTKSDFDATICEQLARSFGKLEVIPYSDRFCIAQAIEIQDENQFFHATSLFIQDNETHIEKLLLTDPNGAVKEQIHLLHRMALNGFFSTVKPSSFLLGEIIKVDNQLWKINPLEFTEVQ